MTFNTYTIVYLITSIFNIVILHRFIMIFFEKRNVKKCAYLLSYILHFLITSMLYLYVDIPFVALFANWGMVFVITLCYKASMLKRVLSSFYIVIFCVATEIIFAACTGYFQYSIFTKGDYGNSTGLIAIRLVTYIEALLLYNFKSVRRNQKVKSSVWIASVLIPVITFVLFVFIIQSGNATQAEVIVATALILLVNFITFYLYDSLAASYTKLTETAVLTRERELYYNQCIMMQNTTDELQAFRHDLKNQLSMVSEFMETKNYKEAAEVIEGLTGKVNTKSLFSTTGNTVIDSIVNYKLQNVENEKIRVKTEITVSPNFEMDVSGCITILGNLLDNALDAVRQVEEEKRFLKLKIVYDKGRLIIQCVNPYITQVQYENGEIVSTKTKKTEHGFGLKNIKKIVEKYNGYMNISHEKQEFSVDILLYFPVDYNK